MEGLRRQRFEDQEVEGALEKIGCEFVVAIAHIDNL
jgi:hypothetical protein